MQVSLADQLSEELKQIENAHRSGPETSALLLVMAVIALGSALLFGAGRFLVTTGPMTEFSQVAAEAGE